MFDGTAHPVQQATSGTFNAQSRNHRQEFLGIPLLVWIGIAIAVAAAVATTALVMRRRKRTHKETKSDGNPGNGPGRRQNIEDILQNPHDGDPKKG